MRQLSQRGGKAGLIALAVVLAAAGASAQTKTRAPQVAIPVASPVQPALSGAELVNRMLRPRPSDPDVPLPSPDLVGRTPAERPPSGPTIYGRGEDGGGVLGLRIPIPADRGVPGSNTRSSLIN